MEEYLAMAMASRRRSLARRRLVGHGGGGGGRRWDARTPSSTPEYSPDLHDGQGKDLLLILFFDNASYPEVPVCTMDRLTPTISVLRTSTETVILSLFGLYKILEL